MLKSAFGQHRSKIDDICGVNGQNVYRLSDHDRHSMSLELLIGCYRVVQPLYQDLFPVDNTSENVPFTFVEVLQLLRSWSEALVVIDPF